MSSNPMDGVGLRSSGKSNKFYFIARRVISFAVPSSVGSLLNILQQTINLAFVGSLNDPIILAAVGMGNMLINIFAVAPFIGMNSGFETFVS